MKCLACGVLVKTFEQWWNQECEKSDEGHDIGEFHALPMEGEE